jgi:uncharacterized protein (DUF1015 family)
MPRFIPFPGVRYDPDRVDLGAVVAPPYDVIDAEERAVLETRSPYNAVHVELGRADPGRDVYSSAASRFDEWLDRSILVTDPEPGFYVYRMGWHDEHGVPRQTSGVIGALELSVPGEGDVLPHERTMGKPKDDRLNLMRACRANLSPVWCLSLAPGLSALSQPAEPPLARCTDDAGVHHRLWRVTGRGALDAIAEVVGSAPVVIADGHHRYETALAYREERRAATGGMGGDADFLMTLVVELTDEQLDVRPIHRLVDGLPDGFDVVGALADHFEPEPTGPDAGGLPDRMRRQEALGLVVPDGAWLLRPRRPDPDRPDSELLERALGALPPHSLGFQHSPEAVTKAVTAGEAQAGVLLRPVAMRHIAAAANAGRRLPEKTSFFSPKPRTGMVFRRLEG